MAAGVLQNTAQVSAPQGDSNLSNNTSVASTTATGAPYSAVPSLTAISPNFVQSGSSSTVVAVTGGQFAADAEVLWNGVAVPTVYVDASDLTAIIDSSKLSSLGWGWISVTNPMPGGGTSSALPLTIYQAISLDTNHIAYDPFTRKIYASVPSTATQVTGNSLVAFDPATGSVSTPVNIGSEPTLLAESDDGKYLYVVLKGSLSVTRYDLIAGSLGADYPLNPPPRGLGPALLVGWRCCLAIMTS